MKIKITCDLFDIAERIKEIDKGYGIVFNTENQKFEVEKDGVTCLVLPYENLDTRTLDRVYYTRSENIERLLADLEKENAEAERKKTVRAQDALEDGLSAALRKNRI